VIGIAVLLGIVVLGSDASDVAVGRTSTLTIDPCVDVDEATIREVMDLEFADGRANDGGFPDAVEVRCQGELLEIRVESLASPERRVGRTIQLAPVGDSTGLAARQARSRELALAIAELVRRIEIASSPSPIAPPPPPPPRSPVTTLALSAAPAPVEKPGRWQVGLMPTYDSFAGGQRFVGGDLIIGARLGYRFMAEIRVGGRAGTQHIVPNGRLSSSVAIAGASAGVLLWPERRYVRLALLLHAQEYLVRFRLEAPADAGTRTALFGAFVVVAGPRLTVALGRRVELGVSAAAGFAPHGIVVRVQGAVAESLTGIVLSGSLAGVFRF
jgi:hypothetical protein